MVVPFTASVAREVLRAVPASQREGAYALGATRWRRNRMTLSYGRQGLIGAIMLGLGRALGETMAVTMGIGNTPSASLSLFAPQYTMAAVLANEFTEAADDLAPARLVRDRPGAFPDHRRHQWLVAVPSLACRRPGRTAPGTRSGRTRGLARAG